MGLLLESQSVLDPISVIAFRIVLASVSTTRFFAIGSRSRRLSANDGDISFKSVRLEAKQ